MATLHRPFSSTIASLYFHQQNAAKKNMGSPLSPTYSSFSVPSPFSSASSNSFPTENSPISESHFDHDAVNSNVTVFPAGPVSVQMYTPQSDIPAPFVSDFDYGMMALASDLKKPQVPFLHSSPHHCRLALPTTGPLKITRRLVPQVNGDCIHPTAHSPPATCSGHCPIHRTSISRYLPFCPHQP